MTKNINYTRIVLIMTTSIQLLTFSFSNITYFAFQYFDDEGYSRNESCALNLVSMFLLISKCQENEK